MCEEVLVFGGNDRITNNGGDVPILDVPSVLCRHLKQRLTVDIIDAADCGKIKAGEWPDIRQFGLVKIDVMESGGDKAGRSDDYTNKQGADTLFPIPSDSADHPVFPR
jgi:hypothetical protein